MTLRASILALWVVFALASQAHAHPYLSAPAVRIGDAPSLPWEGESDFGLSTDLAPGDLVRETLAVLTPRATLLVRYETLRRAAMYLSPRAAVPADARAVRDELLRRLRQRVVAVGHRSALRSLSLFDLGCFTSLCEQDRTLATGGDGYPRVALAASGVPEQRAELDYVLYLLASGDPEHRRPQADERHLGAALDRAEEGSLVADNILRLFQHEFPSLAALREDLGRPFDPFEEGGSLFPNPPPVPGADPADRHAVTLLVSRGLRPSRDDGGVEVGWADEDPVRLRLEVGRRMVVGTRIEYSTETQTVGDDGIVDHIEHRQAEELFGGEPLFATHSTSTLADVKKPGTGGLPARLLARVVVFETDIPGQHHWAPTSGRYRVLWEKLYEAPYPQPLCPALR